MIVLLALLVSCGDGKRERSPAAGPKPTVIAPASTPEAVVIETQTRTPTPVLGPTPTATITLLVIAAIPSGLPAYDRVEWKHWIDEDRDCQNTRHEVLIEESLKKVAFKDDRQCQVATGSWLAPYTGIVVTDATKLDVDHVVPLKNAHDSGGWAWGKDKKAAYANEMGYANQLIAVTASANRKKGASGPEKWKPTNHDYWCDYAIAWVQIKVDWKLSATKAEWTALGEMLKTCENPPSITAVLSTAQSPPAPTPATPSATVMPGSPDIQIVSIDCKRKPESVVIKNTGDSSQILTGWKLEDDGPKFTFHFPTGFSLRPGSSVKRTSGESGDDTDEVVFWNKRTVWNNNGDTASLFNREGEIVSQEDCP